MNRITALVTLFLLMALPLAASAERIHRALSPDVSDMPQCAEIVFEIDMEKPDTFPNPIPQYELRYADINAKGLRNLIAEYGINVPDGERFLNGRDDINKRNFVFCEENHGRYQMYSYPWGARTLIEGHPQEETLHAAMEICRSFLAQAGISAIEEPYYIVQRTGGYGHLGELSAGNSLGRNPPPDEYERMLANEHGLGGDDYTGIGFRYMLGGLPIAVQALGSVSEEAGIADAWGQMTVRDDGKIAAFELWNYREIARELEPYSGSVCTWEDAVHAVLEEYIHALYPNSGEACLRVRISQVEPGLAVTHEGTTFPVWMVCLETEEIGGPEMNSPGAWIYFSRTCYVDARTGKAAGSL